MVHPEPLARKEEPLRPIVGPVETALWLRNPFGYARLVENIAEPRLAWNGMFLHETHIDPDVFARQHFAPGQPFEYLKVQPDETTHVDQDSDLKHPRAVYPTFVHGLAGELLESYMRENPRVVIAGLPKLSDPGASSFYAWLADMQDEHPECTLHIHGGQSFRMLFGIGFGSVDYDPLPAAKMRSVTLPCGKEMHGMPHDQWGEWGQWFKLIGWRWQELTTDTSYKDRIQFNITSAYWAADHYRKEIRFALRRPSRAQMEQVRTLVPEAGNYISTTVRRGAGEGDKIVCDACSLAPRCKLYREGAVCTLPESESRQLAKFFQSRNSDQILEGLARILAIEEERFDEGRERERMSDEGLDPEVSKQLSTMFDHGVKLAKLRNPALTGGTKVNVGVAINPSPDTAQQLAARAIAELRAEGWDRDSITIDMIERKVAGQPVQLAIEAESYEVDDDHD